MDELPNVVVILFSSVLGAAILALIVKTIMDRVKRNRTIKGKSKIEENKKSEEKK